MWEPIGSAPRGIGVHAGPGTETRSGIPHRATRQGASEGRRGASEPFPRAGSAGQRPGLDDPRPGDGERGRRQAISGALARPPLALTALLAAISLSACEKFPTLPGHGGGFEGKIAFVSDRDGNPEIYVVNPDGSKLTNLTKHAALDVGPDWSPDGRRIAFTSDRDGDAGVYVMNADGSGVRRLTTGGAPVWSPDGKRIAFVKGDSAGNLHIHVMNADGSGILPLTSGDGRDVGPTWSPDGKWIAFNALVPDPIISVVRADGTEEKVDITGGGDEVSPAWSPVDRRIAYVDIHGAGTLILVDPDGSNPTRVIDEGDYLGGPAWSPDGREIAVWGYWENHIRILVAKVDGSGLRVLTGKDVWVSDGQWPSWSPDGRKIAFIARPEPFAAPDIYVVDADGAGLKNLSAHPGYDYNPVWQPRPRWW